MGKKTLIAVGLVTALGLLFILGCGRHCCGHLCGTHGGHGHGGRHGDWMIKKAEKELGLNQEQKARLMAARDTLMARRMEFRSARAAFVAELVAQVKGESIDTAKLNALIAEHEGKIPALRQSFIAELAAFHATLSAEQRGKLAELLEKLHARKKKHMDH
jgi:Spy/CpxP family protein refolding chaperone